jgi:alkanesulfonate monooxygenase SsuD/methylene tetrahydromethanopterin reductase-like flavin-dependent oxidoreductase (luciferase family)
VTLGFRQQLSHATNSRPNRDTFGRDPRPAAGNAELNMVQPFASGSVSLRLYPHNDLDAPAIVDELRAQAVLGIQHGFDGVMTAEHHGGFAGYLPNPVQAAGWCLEAMPHGWAAPCPMLLPLRPTALVAEEIAWLASRFPDRVGLGVAAGALRDDFEIMDSTLDDLTPRFAAGLETIAGMLSGRRPGRLVADPAIKRCSAHPVPMVSAAMGFTAVRRAAHNDVGLVFDSLSSPARARELSDAFREAGGTGPCVIIRRAWLGEPPRDRMDRQLDVYRNYSSAAAQTHWEGDQLAAGVDEAEVAERLADAVLAAGAESVNLRVHVPGISPAEAREQIARLGEEVLPPLRVALAPTITQSGRTLHL